MLYEFFTETGMYICTARRSRFGFWEIFPDYTVHVHDEQLKAMRIDAVPTEEKEDAPKYDPRN